MSNMDVQWTDVVGIFRHSLTALAGVAVADGYLSQDVATQAVGAVMFLVGLGWSVWNARKNRQAVVGAKPNV